MRTLSEDGWRLVRNGTTTPEEVLRVTKDQSVSKSPAQDAAAEIVAAGEVEPEEKSNAVVSI